MKYNEKTPLSPKIISKLATLNSDKKHLITTFLDKNHALENLILKYEYGKGKLENINIDANSLIMNDEQHGQFKVHYDIHEFSLCAAVDYLGAEYMMIHFEILTSEGFLLLTGENKPERSDEI